MRFFNTPPYIILLTLGGRDKKGEHWVHEQGEM